ncbi:MAG TPA: hypothetical protein VFY65_00800 [Longimicrobium sp.]|nr:hypothetical protein [Longimicrobium sp.]
MKLKLRLDDLRVDTFHTTAPRKERGTVFGEQCTCWTQCGQNTCPGCPTCDNTCNGANTCANSCAFTCAYTCDDASCGASCNGTCDYSCNGTCEDTCNDSCYGTCHATRVGGGVCYLCP